MIQAQTISKPVTFDEFVAWYPENSAHRYELHNGVIVEMPLGTGDHSDVTGFLRLKLSVEIERCELPYSIPVTTCSNPSVTKQVIRLMYLFWTEPHSPTNRAGKKNPSSRFPEAGGLKRAVP